MPIILMLMIVDLMAFSLIIPIFPVIQSYFQIPESHVGYLMQVFSFFMIVGSIFFGALSDKIGRKYCLSLPILGSAITYFLTPYAETFAMFMVCRAFSGFFSGSFAVAFASTADLSTPENRLKNMSTVGAAFGLSFMVGPIFGGTITQFAHTMKETIDLPFHVSSVVSFIAFTITSIFFKETLPKQDSKDLLRFTTIVKNFFIVLSNKQMLFFSGLNISYVSILASLQIYLGLWLYGKFKLTPAQIGYFWSFGAVVGIIAQMVIRKYFAYANSKKLIIYSFIGLAAGFLVLSLSSNLILVMASMLFLYTSMAFLQSSLNTRISLSGTQNQQGTIFGINQSIAGLGRILGPAYTGFLIMYLQYNNTWVTLGLISLVLSIFAFKFMPNQKK